MVINSNVAASTAAQTVAAFAKPQAAQNSPISGDDQTLLSIDMDAPDSSTEQTAGQDVASLQQTMLQQPNLALASQNNLSPATVFSLLQD